MLHYRKFKAEVDKYAEALEKYLDDNENELMELWDEYKYENFCGEYFHPDNVDYFNEDQFIDMVEIEYQKSLTIKDSI